MERISISDSRRVCATKAVIFRWNLALLVIVCSDASNFAAGCYITQIQDEKARTLAYDPFKLLPVERNYDTYRRELVAVVKFPKSYSHILNGERQSVVYTDYKPLIGFPNAEYIP